jgi:uncharacterized protein (TIGR03435 family)
VKPSPEIPSSPGVLNFATRGFRRSGQRLTCHLPLDAIIGEAYELEPAQLVGPKWLNSGEYAVEAILPAGTTHADSRWMLQSMLVDRFGLRFHREHQDLAGYSLTVSPRGHKLREVSDVDRKKAPVIETPNGPRPMASSQSAGKFRAYSMTADGFAAWLSAYSGHPVVNLTGLKGRYDIELRWEVEEGQEHRAAPPSMAELKWAVEQLGLNLQKRTVPYEMFIIDHVDRAPTGN